MSSHPLKLNPLYPHVPAMSLFFLRIYLTCLKHSTSHLSRQLNYCWGLLPPHPCSDGHKCNLALLAHTYTECCHTEQSIPSLSLGPSPLSMHPSTGSPSSTELHSSCLFSLSKPLFIIFHPELKSAPISHGPYDTNIYCPYVRFSNTTLGLPLMLPFKFGRTTLKNHKIIPLNFKSILKTQKYS